VATTWASGIEPALYGQLADLTPGPVVELNRAEADGPAAGLALLERLSGAGGLADSHLYHAARADLLTRLARNDDSALAYRRALQLAGTAAERRFLDRRPPSRYQPPTLKAAGRSVSQTVVSASGMSYPAHWYSVPW